MPETYEAVSCPVCRGPTQMVQTKAFGTRAAQFAIACSTHGRVQANWYTTAAGARAVGTCLPNAKKKHAAPV